MDDEVENPDESINVENSILLTIKKLLGITPEYTHFDSDVIAYINSVFLELSQIGVDDKNSFFITDYKNCWDELMPESNLLNAIKMFVYLKVKLLFDPPTNTGVIDSINRQIDHLVWRINIESELKDKTNNEEEEKNE